MPDRRVKNWPKLVAAYCIKAKYGYTLKAGETEGGHPSPGWLAHGGGAAARRSWRRAGR
jgi:hypothetical protein